MQIIWFGGRKNFEGIDQPEL